MPRRRVPGTTGTIARVSDTAPAPTEAELAPTDAATVWPNAAAGGTPFFRLDATACPRACSRSLPNTPGNAAAPDAAIANTATVATARFTTPIGVSPPAKADA